MKTIRLIAILFIAVSFFLAGCEKMETKTDMPTLPNPLSQQAPESQGQNTASVPTGTVSSVVFETAVGPVTFAAEVADTEAERALGLMNRESLPEKNGMWFTFPQMGFEKFWMKNTLIPLDMIFVDDQMKVVYIVENAMPESTELIATPVAFKYVFEVNGGMAGKKGIKVGQTVKRSVGPTGGVSQ